MHVLSTQARSESETPTGAGVGDNDGTSSPGGRISSTPTTPSARRSTPPLRTLGSTLRLVLIDLPLTILFATLLLTLLLRHLYTAGYVSRIVHSLRRSPDRSVNLSELGKFYPEYEFDLTYYNRQCDAEDISTADSSDLLIGEDFSPERSADVMMEHGAVVFRNVLSNSTAAELRSYLESRHSIQDKLPWHEKFYEEIDRLALGLGAHDTPVITRALIEVGTNPTVRRALEGIVGPDPAILEISTMTSMAGADDQGIHTDSDYFGSALLYSRTFLHSYTMFMALQDTTAAMGATTLCPGSHHCANRDLEDVCLQNGAFESSSNGHTGEKGVLQRGDAMMFNQNVWHRGAANDDPANPDTNRVMFIITFASRTRDNPSDYRYQALGTYYYQRFNMWGHTFNDLKDADTVMRQPLAALRAYGIYKPKNRRWGITWIEHMARELANVEHFYSGGELKDFCRFLDKIGVPRWVMGKYGRTRQKSDRKWEPFLEETMDNAVALLVKLNVGALGVYIGLRVMFWLVTSLLSVAPAGGAQKQRRRGRITPPFIRRVVLTHGTVALSAYLLLLYLNSTELAKWANSGQAFVRPFPDPDVAKRVQMAEERSDYGLDLGVSTSVGKLDKAHKADKKASNNDKNKLKLKRRPLGPTTFPERLDVLIGTRFDAPFLASLNHMLDYHPGDKRYHSILNGFVNLPFHSCPGLLGDAVRAINKFVTEAVDGVSPRFLLQDWTDGYWALMSPDDALEITRRELIMRQSAVRDGLGRHLRAVRAEGRFGWRRGTVMMRRFVSGFVRRWEGVVFGGGVSVGAATVDAAHDEGKGTTPGRDKPRRAAVPSRALFVRVAAPVPKSAASRARDALADRRHERYVQRDLRRRIEDPVSAVIHVGDRILGRFGGTRGRYLEGKLRKAYSSTEGLVEYKSGHFDRLPTKKIRRYVPLVEGEVVQAQYNKGRDGWFQARITRAHPLGTYDVHYDDGEREFHVRPQFIRRVDEELDDVFLRVDPTAVDVPVTGERVEANYEGRGEWFEGHVFRNNGDGTFFVWYADGDKEDGVPRDRIRYPVD